MGVGFCRRLGMEKSKELTNNHWVFFIDSDDYMASPYSFNQYLWLASKYPDANISPIDYDPGASETNQTNRLKLLMTVAKDNLKLKNNQKNSVKNENKDTINV